MERIVGRKTHTGGDRGGTFPGLLGRPYQFDCVDEATNTTTYLTMMYNDGLLKWHTIDDHESRGLLTLQLPHTTAVISDETSGKRFTVDSWFHDNGVFPEIVTLTQWENGWSPD